MIELTKKNEAFIKINADAGTLKGLSDHFTFFVPNYFHMPLYKNKVWDGKKRLYNGATQTIYHGLHNQVLKWAKENDYPVNDNTDANYEFSLIEAVEAIQSFKLNPEKAPRDYQIEAFVSSIREKRSLLLCPTASGKSLIIYLLMRFLLKTERRGLIVVPTTSLVEQMYSDFEEYSTTFSVEDACHRIYAGKDKETKKPVIITTWQSIYTQPAKYFAKFDFVIGDEAHTFQAKSLESIMSNLVNADYRIGTTGTLSGAETHQMVLEGLFGPVRQVTTTAELIEKGYLSKFNIKALVLKHPDAICKAAKAKEFDYEAERKYLIQSNRRNNFIKNLAISLKENTLILFRYVEHGKELYRLIKEATDRKVYFVYGKTDTDIREDIRKIVSKEKEAIVVASVVFATGVNIPSLHNIIFASPSRGRIKVMQSIGRSLRLHDDKEVATLFDIADDLRSGASENYTYKHFKIRLEYYVEEGFDYKTYRIQLKES